MIAEIYREEFGRVVATLVREVGDFDLAEDCAQEAFATALQRWGNHGVPAKPGAWLLVTARRKAIDRLRREANLARKTATLQIMLELQRRVDEDPEDAPPIPDDRLLLIFMCCHPALSQEAQVALTLRTLGGLATAEVARAFLVSEATMAQRLVRAKRKIKAAGIPYRIPAEHLLPDRIVSVLETLYLIFNEGYASMSDASLVRADLCKEAIRLSMILSQLMPDEAEVLGLTALMLFQDSRRDARVDARGDLVLLDDQDRSLWDADAIALGNALLQRASRYQRFGPYQIQAAIASLHAEATGPDQTDWAEIAALYGKLLDITESPVVALNRAVAVAMHEGPARGLGLVEGLREHLDSYYLFHAARADLLRRLNLTDQARAAYERAIDLATNPVEQSYLARRLSEVGAPAED